MILETLYFVLPGFCANMAPIIVKNHFRSLAVPVDMGVKWRGKPLLGTHKTVRGFIAGVIAAVFVVFLQKLVYYLGYLHSWAYIDYSAANAILVGSLLGLGALVGDSFKSLIKRRFGIKEGERFMPWDQLDYVIGMGIFALFIKPLTFSMWLELIIAGFLLHIIVTRIGYFTGLRKEKW
jgi:CDP-2,3-bis-(O-geranylgeranyl)-sn-glycerol synthase